MMRLALRLVLMWAALTELGAFSAVPPKTPNGDLIVVVGAAGDAEFGEAFAESGRRLLEHGRAAGFRVASVGLEPSPGSASPKSALQGILENLPRNDAENSPLWLVLLGHGTHDGRTARFNLDGPDFSSDELALWLKPFTRPLCIVNSAPASAPFVRALSGTNRVVITATRSAQERNATRFGTHFPLLLADVRSDRDKDRRISALEAFLAATAAVEEEYRAAGRLATEHALFDDNGDGVGTPGSKFKGVRPQTKEKDAVLDGALAHRLFFFPSSEIDALPAETKRRVQELEEAVESLRERKASFPTEAEYLGELEILLLQLAQLTQGVPAPAAPAAPEPAKPSNSAASVAPPKSPSRTD
ncbi:MAG: hypothetical protein FJ404_11655 [Verrucomicrobia bacterium]|nr:hypothetical protein [Verrucomicrobiota bacterium]